MRHPRYAHHRSQDQSDREQQDRPKISPKIAPRSKKRRRINERRQKEIEDNVRIEFHLRQTRNKTQSQSGEHQYDRIWQIDLLRDDDERRHQA